MQKSKNTKTKTKIESTVAPIESAPTPAKAEKSVRIVSGLTGTYSGVSSSFGKKPSRTRIITESFAQKIGATLTERDNNFLRDLKAAYGKNEFQRADLDAGNLRRAGERGFIEYISGDTASASALFKLTERALTSKF